MSAATLASNAPILQRYNRLHEQGRKTMKRGSVQGKMVNVMSLSDCAKTSPAVQGESGG